MVNPRPPALGLRAGSLLRQPPPPTRGPGTDRKSPADDAVCGGLQDQL